MGICHELVLINFYLYCINKTIYRHFVNLVCPVEFDLKFTRQRFMDANAYQIENPNGAKLLLKIK